VPRAFGGQYWGDDLDVVEDPTLDGREMHREVDTNNVHQAQIASEIVARLRSELRPEADPEKLSEAILQSTSLGDITEFGRAVHAEMAAITAAARNGVSLLNATLATDTFPCHNCARHIIATGIRRVVYIAPYAKSQALKLHNDAIVVAPADAAEAERSLKVIFQPFIGVSPRRFSHWFNDIKRKSDDGKIVVFDARKAKPRLGAATPYEAALEVIAYRARERADRAVFSRRRKTSDPPVRSDVYDER
jgi:deoxycytidylate deaminase